MIIDTLANAHKYFSLHPLFEKAFAYITTQDLEKTEPGKYEVDGNDLNAIFSNKKGMTTEESTAKFECHNAHIDIQLCINGTETYGWKPRENCQKPKGEYNPEKDVLFFDDKPDMFFQLTNGQFVILFPEDVHAPMIGDESIQKLVMKVRT
jgi:YhcH/YjgK/YiaL family protein